VNWYPGLQLRPEGEEWVAGDLFRLKDSRLLGTLDQYEGSTEYRRVLSTAVLTGGERIRCWVYEFTGGVMEGRRVRSGDWLEG
jgi:gamma-glutamylcyclotransferase (GGCT)/AIG2-like uncharacterized protein YtfP